MCSSDLITQAVAADLLREALPRLEDAGFPVVFHAHDEVVVEVPATADESVLHQVEQLMAQSPLWAKDMPITAEGWRAFRYRK